MPVMHWTQFAGIVVAAAITGLIREVIRPAYQAWVVRQVQSGRWTRLQAQKFDHRIDMAIWLPFVFVVGMIWGVFLPYML